MKGSLIKLCRGAAAVAIMAAASACSNGAQNPLAPDAPTLTPGSASLSVSTVPGVALPPNGGDGETLGYTLGWP